MRDPARPRAVAAITAAVRGMAAAALTVACVASASSMARPEEPATPVTSLAASTPPTTSPVRATTTTTAPTPTYPPGFPSEVRALLPLGIDARLPGWSVRWEPSRPGYLGATYPARRTIEIYVRPGRSVALTAQDLAHELGHALDVTYLGTASRQQWAERRRIDPSSWFDCDMCEDFATPSGDWAESVAVCLTGDRRTFRSRLAPAPTAADCEWIAASVGGW